MLYLSCKDEISFDNRHYSSSHPEHPEVIIVFHMMIIIIFVTSTSITHTIIIMITLVIIIAIIFVTGTAIINITIRSQGRTTCRSLAAWLRENGERMRK